MLNNDTARASDIKAAHTENDTEKAGIELALPATNHLSAILSMFPSLPEGCQEAIRANVEALTALTA